MILRHDGKYIRIGNGFLKTDDEGIVISCNPDGFTEMQYITDTFDADADKIAFVFRHSERYNSEEDGDGDNILGDLTENGKIYAEWLGAALKSLNKLTSSNTEFYCTTTYRTGETCRHIGKTLFDVELDDVKTTEANDVIKPSYTSSTSWPSVAKFPTTSDDETQWNKLSKSTCINILKMTTKYSISVSHDLNLIPFVKWCSDRKISFDFNGRSGDPWLCYLAGVAIIQKENSVKTVPIYCITKYADGSVIGTIGDIGDSGYKGVMRSKENSGYGNILKSNK